MSDLLDRRVGLVSRELVGHRDPRETPVSSDRRVLKVTSDSLVHPDLMDYKEQRDLPEQLV